MHVCEGVGVFILFRENIQGTLGWCYMLNVCPVHMPLNKQEGLLSLDGRQQRERQWQEEIKYCTNKLLMI